MLCLHYKRYCLFQLSQVIYKSFSVKKVFRLINTIISPYIFAKAYRGLSFKMTNIMGNTPAEESSGSFDEAAFKKIVQDVFTTTSHSESYPNNLSGSIHPIFSRGQWHIHPAILQHDSDGEEFLRLIDPVLHLTSNLLQSPNSRLFLAYIFYAGREYLVDVSNRLGRVMRQFNKIEGLDFSEALVRTTALLDRLAGQIDFRWFDPANPANDDERRFGHSLGFCKRREASACISDSGEATGYMSCISLNLDMFVKLRDLHRSLQDGSLAKVEGISVSKKCPFILLFTSSC